MAAVRQFYKESTILISGATGFLGQILLEKALRTLQPRKVYVLIREKKGVNAPRRLQQLMNGVVFDRVRTLPNISTKIEAIEVDLNRPDLALNVQTRRQLEQEVNVVFQIAASVKFNESLDVSLRENVRNNLHIYNLVKQMENLQSAMQVSTMYSNCDKSVIREKVYDDIGFGGYDSITNLLTHMTDHEKRALEPFILRNLPNTYTFAKKCVEAKIEQEFSGLPVGIFRPPGITSTYQEPLVGWINNLYGLGGYILPTLLGLYSATFVDNTKIPLFAPVDYCSNALLLSAVDVARNYNPTQSTVPVYNYADDCCPPYGKTYEYLVEGLPWSKRFIYRYSMNIRTTNEIRYRLAVQLMRAHASAMDQLRVCNGQRPRIRQAIERALQMMEKSQLLATSSWEVENANFQRIVKNLDPEERLIFPCDLRTVDWRRHFAEFSRGTMKHVLKMS